MTIAFAICLFILAVFAFFVVIGLISLALRAMSYMLSVIFSPIGLALILCATIIYLSAHR